MSKMVILGSFRGGSEVTFVSSAFFALSSGNLLHASKYVRARGCRLLGRRDRAGATAYPLGGRSAGGHRQAGRHALARRSRQGLRRRLAACDDAGARVDRRRVGRVIGRY